MEYTHFIKRQSFILALAVIAIVVGIGFTSYAIFATQKEGNEQVVQAGSLQITMTDGTVITSEMVPVDDTTGNSSTPYHFSINNTGTLPMTYQVKLTNKIPSGSTANDLIPHQYLKATINKSTPKLLSSYTKEDATVAEATAKYIIFTGNIAAGATVSHDIRLWIDNDAPTTIINKLVSIDLQVTGTVQS